MAPPAAKLFKPLTISAENLPASMARQEAQMNYAVERSRLLFGCYRTGDANDPDTYVAAVTAVLARFPEEIITQVTHPDTGLPSNGKGWLPTVKEVKDACNQAYEPILQNELRLKRIKEQMEMREREERGERPSLAQLKDKYGQNWGSERRSKPSGRSSPLPRSINCGTNISTTIWRSPKNHDELEERINSGFSPSSV